MNHNDTDTRPPQDTLLREAIARRERKRRPMPTDLNERLMRRMEGGERRTGIHRRWLSAAACLLFIIGVGVAVLSESHKAQPDGSVVAVSQRKPEARRPVTKRPADDKAAVADVTDNGDRTVKKHVAKHHSAPVADVPTDKTNVEEEHWHRGVAGGGQLVYASTAETTDSATYREPSLVDNFIAKLAAYHDVRPAVLDCTEPADTGTVSTVYVFPDRKEVDVFGRLMQVACFYDSSTPGYHLSISNQQLLFEMRDTRKGTRHLWLAEKLCGSVLLYCRCAPDSATTSSACYHDFRERFVMPALKSDYYHQF